MEKTQMKGTARVKPTSQPQLMGVPSRQSQYHQTVLKKRLEVQPNIPQRKTTNKVTTQKSTRVSCFFNNTHTLAHIKRLRLDLCRNLRLKN